MRVAVNDYYEHFFLEATESDCHRSISKTDNSGQEYQELDIEDIEMESATRVSSSESINSIEETQLTMSEKLPRRSVSCKRFKRRPDISKRRYSVPEEKQLSCHLCTELEYRVRHFSISRKGLILNRGDSFKRKSVVSIESSKSSDSDKDAYFPCSEHESHVPFIHDNNQNWPNQYKIAILGDSGVGRNALTRQFLTSEDLSVTDSFDDDSNLTVSVRLDQEESELTFLPSQSLEEFDDISDADAIVVVYSIADRSSFTSAVSTLQRLRKEMKHTGAVLLVGNKSDLARTRAVSDNEGKCTATKYGCKFIETSVVLNHQIDVLLVGIVRQIRCRQRQTNETHEAKGKVTKAAKGFLARILKRHNKRAGSPCDKLFEL